MRREGEEGEPPYLDCVIEDYLPLKSLGSALVVITFELVSFSHLGAILQVSVSVLFWHINSIFGSFYEIVLLLFFCLLTIRYCYVHFFLLNPCTCLS